MTKYHANNNADMSRCCKCDHDLITNYKAETTGKVYCSNQQCIYASAGHPTTDVQNKGES